MGAYPYDASFVQNDNLISIHHGADSLGYYKHCGIEGFFFERSTQSRIRFKIKCREAVVKDVYFRLSHQRASNGKTLLLTARNVGATLSNLCIELTRHL